MKKTALTFIVCSLLTYVLSFACAFFGFIGPVFWVGIGVPSALLCAFPMVYLLGKNRIPGQMLLTFKPDFERVWPPVQKEQRAFSYGRILTDVVE